MTTPILILIIFGIILLFIIIIAFLYLIALLRRTNIVIKKVDYLVEDVTYKSESLNVGVEAVNKISNYVLSFDTISKKSSTSLVKLISENRTYIYSFADKLKGSLMDDETIKNVASKAKGSTKNLKKDKKSKSKKILETKKTNAKESKKVLEQKEDVAPKESSKQKKDLENNKLSETKKIINNSSPAANNSKEKEESDKGNK